MSGQFKANKIYNPDGALAFDHATAVSFRLSDANKLSLDAESTPSWARGKRSFDIFLSLMMLVAAFPIVLILVLLVARSGQPIVFSQERVGRQGIRFRCYKFRTMIPNAENMLDSLLAANPSLQAEWDRDHKLRSDPRITRIGSFLRKTSLDELPQLINVLKGDMSLVGPRPVVQDELNKYGRAARWYLMVRPGVTGLWQVSGRTEIDYRRRVALDTYYVRSRNILLDLTILFRTIKVVLVGRGAY